MIRMEMKVIYLMPPVIREKYLVCGYMKPENYFKASEEGGMTAKCQMVM
ncbi:MAG: hypothetical protein ACLSG9_06440 [Eubacterium sp.]